MPSTLRALAVSIALLAALPLALPAGAPAAPTRCPDTFRVLHDDHIGKLSLPAGPYVIDVIDSTRLSCDDAADYFRQFLEDFDGKLPRPWIVDVATRTFTRGSGSTTGFTVTRSSGGGGGGHHHPATGKACPGFFHVLRNDHIGKLKLPKGEYRITLLSVGRISCARAARYFTQFLQDFDGKLPKPWTLDVETGTFERGSRNIGFRVKPTGNPASASSGGTIYPGTGETRCPGTFRVLHRDRIGRLRLPAGRYVITTLPDGPSCSSASNRFRRFLNDPVGTLPSPWVLSAKSGTFRRGKGTDQGFRVKPVKAR